MRVKVFEVRDSMTFIPVWAFRVRADADDPDAEQYGDERPATEAQAFLLRRAGFGGSHDAVMMGSLAGMACEYDPHAWRNETLRAAHVHIAANFDKLADGAVVDVEYITGKTHEPKVSERIEREQAQSPGLEDDPPAPLHDTREDDDDTYPPACTNPDSDGRHDWVEQGTEDGESGTGRTVCSWCGADGDA